MSSGARSLGAVGLLSGAVASKKGDSRAGSIKGLSSVTGISNGSLNPRVLGMLSGLAVTTGLSLVATTGLGLGVAGCRATLVGVAAGAVGFGAVTV